MITSLKHIHAATAHRPYPMPTAPWVMTQTWHNLLFAHWPIPAETMRALIPPGLTLDTFDGRAWIGVVPFRMSDVRYRFTPAMPGLSRFPELNVRTYVTHQDKPGVFFFSLDAANAIAVAVARAWFHLPYFRAKMTLTESDNRQIDYHSQRTHRKAPPGDFIGQYGPSGPEFRASPGTLEHWLTERYCLYASDRRAQLHRGEIQHIPWPLQPAQANFQVNTVAQSHGIPLPDTPPLLHYAHEIRVLIWSLERC